MSNRGLRHTSAQVKSSVVRSAVQPPRAIGRFGGSNCCWPGSSSCPRRPQPVCIDNCDPDRPLQIEIAEPLCLGVRNCDPTEALLIDGVLGIENAVDTEPFNVAGCLQIDNKDGQDFNVFVTNSCERPLKVDANVWADVEGCITINTCPTDPILVDGMMIVENGTEPFEIGGCLGIKNCDNERLNVAVEGVISVDNVGSESFCVAIENKDDSDPFAVKIGWNKECPDAVPVFGRLEVCNCADDVFQVAIDGPIGIENATSDPLCVALENKQDGALCVETAKKVQVEKQTVFQSQFLVNQTNAQPSQTFDIITSPADRTTCVNSVRAYINFTGPDPITSDLSIGFIQLQYENSDGILVSIGAFGFSLCSWLAFGSLRTPLTNCAELEFDINALTGCPVVLAPGRKFRLVWDNQNIDPSVFNYQVTFFGTSQPV